MGVNLSEATPDKFRHKRFGKNYWDIDFDVSEKLTANEYANQYEKGVNRPVIGVLRIGKLSIPVTKKELERIRETTYDAEHTVDMAYRLGQLK